MIFASREITFIRSFERYGRACVDHAVSRRLATNVPRYTCAVVRMHPGVPSRVAEGWRHWLSDCFVSAAALGGCSRTHLLVDLLTAELWTRVKALHGGGLTDGQPGGLKRGTEKRNR
jgi:hypothetical protein